MRIFLCDDSYTFGAVVGFWLEVIGLLEPEADHGTERMGVVAEEDAHDNP